MSPTYESTDASRHYFRMMLDSHRDRPPSGAVIGLLYTELIHALDRLIAALDAAAADAAAANENTTQDAEIAQSILNALADSVDYERGGQLAPVLSGLYARAGRELAEGLSAANIDNVRRLRAAVSDIAYGWQAASD